MGGRSVRKFLILATPRSGTGYAAQALSVLGLPCGHERYFGLETRREAFLESTDDWGDSSWLAVPFIDQLPDTIALFHLVRNPLKVIRSLVEIQMFDLDERREPRRTGVRKRFSAFALEHCPQIRDLGSEVERAAWFYYHWNQRIIRLLDGRDGRRIPVEQFDAYAREILEALGADDADLSEASLAARLQSIPLDVNAKAFDKAMLTRPITWLDLPAEIHDMARSFGYEPDSGRVVVPFSEPAPDLTAAVQQSWESLAALEADTSEQSPQTFAALRRNLNTWQQAAERDRMALVAEATAMQRETIALRTLVRELQTTIHSSDSQARELAKERARNLREQTGRLRALAEERKKIAELTKQRELSLQTQISQLLARIDALQKRSCGWRGKSGSRPARRRCCAATAHSRVRSVTRCAPETVERHTAAVGIVRRCGPRGERAVALEEGDGCPLAAGTRVATRASALPTRRCARHSAASFARHAAAADTAFQAVARRSPTPARAKTRF